MYRAFQYGVDRGQTYRDLEYLCTFLHLITAEGEMNPLGNQGQSTKVYPEYLLANHNAVTKTFEKNE